MCSEILLLDSLVCALLPQAFHTPQKSLPAKPETEQLEVNMKLWKQNGLFIAT